MIVFNIFAICNRRTASSYSWRLEQVSSFSLIAINSFGPNLRSFAAGTTIERRGLLRRSRPSCASTQLSLRYATPTFLEGMGRISRARIPCPGYRWLFANARARKT